MHIEPSASPFHFDELLPFIYNSTSTGSPNFDKTSGFIKYEHISEQDHAHSHNTSSSYTCLFETLVGRSYHRGHATQETQECSPLADNMNPIEASPSFSFSLPIRSKGGNLQADAENHKQTFLADTTRIVNDATMTTGTIFTDAEEKNHLLRRINDLSRILRGILRRSSANTTGHGPQAWLQYVEDRLPELKHDLNDMLSERCSQDLDLRRARTTVVRLTRELDQAKAAPKKTSRHTAEAKAERLALALTDLTMGPRA